MTSDDLSQTREKEIAVGITQFVNKINLGFSGVLKQRYSSFPPLAVILISLVSQSHVCGVASNTLVGLKYSLLLCFSSTSHLRSDRYLEYLNATNYSMIYCAIPITCTTRDRSNNNANHSALRVDPDVRHVNDIGFTEFAAAVCGTMRYGHNFQ